MADYVLRYSRAIERLCKRVYVLDCQIFTNDKDPSKHFTMPVAIVGLSPGVSYKVTTHSQMEADYSQVETNSCVLVFKDIDSIMYVKDKNTLEMLSPKCVKPMYPIPAQTGTPNPIAPANQAHLLASARMFQNTVRTR